MFAYNYLRRRAIVRPASAEPNNHAAAGTGTTVVLAVKLPSAVKLAADCAASPAVPIWLTTFASASVVPSAGFAWL